MVADGGLEGGGGGLGVGGAEANGFAAPVCAAGGRFEGFGPDEFYSAGGGAETGYFATGYGFVEEGDEICCGLMLGFGEGFALEADLGFLFGGGGWGGGGGGAVVGGGIVGVEEGLELEVLFSGGEEGFGGGVGVVPGVDGFGAPECVKAGALGWRSGNSRFLFGGRDQFLGAWRRGRWCSGTRDWRGLPRGLVLGVGWDILEDCGAVCGIGTRWSSRRILRLDSGG